MKTVRVAVVGAGEFGRHHLRVLSQMPGVDVVGVVDTHPARVAAAAGQYGVPVFEDVSRLAGRADAATVAVPTTAHAAVTCRLLSAGLDVLVEKPIAADLASARQMVETARAAGRLLQVGHLERFNPAVAALRQLVTIPLFFEVHRLSVFSPRSLDIDVVLDLMIHDIDIVLSLVGAMPDEVRAAGISILSPKVDIANVRLAFPGGCIANLTASRVSTERVRKLRLFQPHQYVSLDYSRQDGAVFSVSADRQIGFTPLETRKDEPLRLELSAFAECVRTRMAPEAGGESALLALEAALAILGRIEEHSQLVAKSLSASSAQLASHAGPAHGCGNR